MTKKVIEQQETQQDEIPEELKNGSATLKITNEILTPDHDRLLDMSRLTKREKPIFILLKIQSMLPRIAQARKVGEIINIEEEIITLFFRMSRAGDGKLIEDGHRLNKVEAEKGKEDSLSGDNWN